MFTVQTVSTCYPNNVPSSAVRFELKLVVFRKVFMVILCLNCREKTTALKRVFHYVPDDCLYLLGFIMFFIYIYSVKITFYK